MRRLVAISCLAALSVAVMSGVSASAAGPSLPGAVSAKPAKVGFGGVKLLTTESVTVTLTNNTTGDEIFNTFFAPAGYGYANFGCSNIAAGGTCTFDLIFEATVKGRVAGTFQMNFSPTGGEPYYAVQIPVSASAH